MTRLDLAVRAARRVRRSLIRWRRDTDLGGDCALASLLVAAAIGDVASLRHHDLPCKSWSPHVWNVVDGVVVDVTATQFNDLDEFQPYVRGVLVTRAPRVYHVQVSGEGAATLAYLTRSGGSWYDEDDEYRRFGRALALCSKVASVPAAPYDPRHARHTRHAAPCSRLGGSGPGPVDHAAEDRQHQLLR